jgi:ubiquinone/menaquinone biosynthesis C-methylase UbiE
MKRNFWRFAPILTALAVVAGAWRVYNMRIRERTPNLEGLEDPEIAAAFDFIAGLPHMRFLRRYAIQRALRLKSSGLAADLGCGPGHLVLEMAKLAPDLHITGVDLADEVLQRAEESAKSSDVAKQVSFRKGDAQAIPFADDSLDLVISTLSLHHWTDPVQAFDEIARVLRPGGAFVIFDLRRDMAPPAYLLIWFVTRFIVPQALRRIDEPLNSRNASYTPVEASALVEMSKLVGARVAVGPLWLTIEGVHRDSSTILQYS